MKSYASILAKGFINSYSQLFFADSKIFAWLLLLSTFVNPVTGLSGVIATLAALLFAYWVGMDRQYISYGAYSYNALMVGLVLGSQYNFTWGFLLVLCIAAVLSLLLAVWFNALLAKYKLVSLSLSFLVTTWLIMIGLRSFSSLELSEAGLFRMNEWFRIGGTDLVGWMSTLESESIPGIVSIYLKSLSAVFFQYNIISGAIILTGLLIWSRIAFILSMLGFVIGYLFYYSLSGEFSQLYYSYIGFNFILTAIALGGFYVIPSRSSFILVIIITPVIGILISALSGLLDIYQLPLYSLPFSIVVLLILMLLQNRAYASRLTLVPYQYFSPEKNLYQYTNNKTRFKNSTWYPMQLPFYGEWFVSQGYDGKITHKEDWRYALDFVVVDETSHTFKLPGEELTDFYCFDLPVLAPADGYIAEIADGYEDNDIGGVDLQHNWGNTIVIKHADGLYSKLCHLRNGSISVNVNEFVKAGQIIARCGSSGRSPEPHLHFQSQATSYIGSGTLSYPLGYFVSRAGEKYTFHSFETPLQGSHIHNPVKTPLLAEAFAFAPGKKITFEVTHENGKKEHVTWECFVNAWNQQYIYCHKTGSTAWFENNGTLFYFTDYTGDKKAALFEFYLAAQKILLGYYQDMEIADTIAATRMHPSWALWLQDIVAPFYMFMKVEYSAVFKSLDNIYAPSYIIMKSNVTARLFNKKVREKEYEMHFAGHRLDEFIATRNGKVLFKAKCTDIL